MRVPFAFVATAFVIVALPAQGTVAPAAKGLAEARRLAAAAMATSDVTERFELLTQAIEACPDVDGPHFLLAVAHHERGNQEDALREYEKCLSINPEHYRARFNVGQLRMQRGEYMDAVTAFERALKSATTLNDTEAARLALSKKTAAELIVTRDVADKARLQDLIAANDAKLGQLPVTGTEDGAPNALLLRLTAHLRDAAAVAANALPPNKQRERVVLRVAASLLGPATADGSSLANRQDSILLAVDLLAYVYRDDPESFAKLDWLFRAWGARLEPDAAAQIAGVLEDANRRRLGHDDVGHSSNDEWTIRETPANRGSRIQGRYRLESTFRDQVRVETATADVVVTQSEDRVEFRQTNTAIHTHYTVANAPSDRHRRGPDTVTGGTIQGRDVILDVAGRSVRVTFSADGRTASFSSHGWTGSLTRR